MPSSKISWRNNVNEEGKKFFVPNLQHCLFGQDGWKTFSCREIEYELVVTCVENLAIEKIRCYFE